jgi:hypothetical protein
VVVGYVVHVLSGKGESFVNEGCVRDSDACDDASLDWHCQFLLQGGLLIMLLMLC